MKVNFFLLDSIRIASSLHYVQRELIIIVLTIVSRSRQYQFFVLQFFFHCDSISTTLNGIKFLLFYVKVVLNFGQSINGMIIMIIVFLSFAYYTQLEFKFNFEFNLMSSFSVYFNYFNTVAFVGQNHSKLVEAKMLNVVSTFNSK